MNRIFAVVVTYNKVDLLKECLNNLIEQTIDLEGIIVINNASTDGTKAYLNNLNSDKIISIHCEKNLGGAGGFNLGVKKAVLEKADYIWIMDDDTIVKVNAAQIFLDYSKQLNNDFSLLAGNVRWIDGHACAMNIPKVSSNWIEESSQGLIGITSSSFVSMFVNAKAVKKVGYPITDFFIWGDDVEYSERLSKFSPAYFVADSIAIHKMGTNTGVDILSDKKERIPRYFYEIRNRLYISKRKGIKQTIKYILFFITLQMKIIFKKNKNKIPKIYYTNKGFLYGIFFNPKIEIYEGE